VVEIGNRDAERTADGKRDIERSRRQRDARLHGDDAGKQRERERRSHFEASGCSPSPACGRGLA